MATFLLLVFLSRLLLMENPPNELHHFQSDASSQYDELSRYDVSPQYDTSARSPQAVSDA